MLWIHLEICLECIFISERDVAYNLFTALKNGLKAPKIPTSYKTRSLSAQAMKRNAAKAQRPQTAAKTTSNNTPNGFARQQEDALLKVAVKSIR